jgi:Damage-control phosphatase ARMT1-like domain
MNDKLIYVSDLRPLGPEIVERYLSTFLCDDAKDPEVNSSIMVDPNFLPDSFSVQDRMSDNAFLAEEERDFVKRLSSLVEIKLDMLEIGGSVKFAEAHKTVIFCVDQVQRLLAFPLSGQSVASVLLNQELPFVIDRVLSYCLFGDLSFEIYTHKDFNAFACKAIPNILQNRLWRKDICLENLLLYSIASGLIGIDMKRSSPPMTDFIPFRPLLGREIEFFEENIWSKLNAIVTRGFTLGCWDDFSKQVIEQECNLVWFLDDYIESLFDLILIQELLIANRRLRITLVPKNGRFDNDAAYEDITELLHLPLFDGLSQPIASRRLKVSPHGPRMGTANLKKLSIELVEEIRQCDCIFIKGSGIHEMFQGGINKPCYTAYVLAREFNESESGFDARLGPLLFFRTEPSEYAFWGFKGRAKRNMTFDDGREIAICFSTIREHEHRKRMVRPQEIHDEMQMLIQMKKEIGNEYTVAFNKELRFLERKLTASTLSLEERAAIPGLCKDSH